MDAPLFIDEPTTGLHWLDIQKLLDLLLNYGTVETPWLLLSTISMSSGWRIM